MEKSQKLSLYQDLLSCVTDVPLWHLDSHFEIISTSSNHPEAFQTCFSFDDSLNAVKNYFSDHKTPLIVTNSLSTTWIITANFVEDTIIDYYMIGPTFTSPISSYYLQQKISQFNLGLTEKQRVNEILNNISVVSFQTLIQYGIMLYFIISDEKILSEQITFLGSNYLEKEEQASKAPSGAMEYEIQQEIMQAVENGDINYAHPNRMLSASVGTISKEGPLRQAKNLMISFITEITRAAIRGGMAADEAFYLSDYYILLSEDCANEAEVYLNGQTCLRDFTNRVHSIKQSGFSKITQDTLDYIFRNITEKITMDDLSSYLGYNKNYISTRIKNDTDMTVGQIIIEQKLKKAETLLTSSNKSVQEIAYLLGFESPSYFTMKFRRKYEMSPKQYRNRNSKK